MNKEWSLKEHKRSMYKLFLDGRDNRIWTPEDYFYLKEDIDILHKKIIRLVDNALNTEENPKWVISQINKLFGIRE